MKRLNTFFSRLAVATLPIALLFSACNSSEDDAEEVYSPVESVAISSFSLRADATVMKNLDSVFFSIDLKHGVIFNADSLPKGTNIKKLIANINFPSTVSSAIVEMSGGSHRTGSFDYKANSSDTIDFTGNVTISLTTASSLSKTYKLKVNVRKSNPDSLLWDKKAYSSLQASSPSALSQKSVKLGKAVYSLIEEANHSYTLASTPSMSALSWTTTSLSLPFSAVVESFSVSNGKFFILASDGTLYTSSDARSWTATSEKWDSIIGAYGNSLLGLALSGSDYIHVSYPRDANYGMAAEDSFPVKGRSNFAIFSSKWSDESTGFFVGGTDRHGNVSKDTWAYDGTTWTVISSISLPELQDVCLVPYYIYRRSSTSSVMTEYSLWMAMGGRNADGSLSNAVFMSYDNGVNWVKAPTSMQFPSFIPALYSTDILVENTQKSFDLSDAWKSRAIRRVAYDVDGNQVIWECPYLYLFGGYDKNGNLNHNVWRGVLARLSYHPLF